MSEVILFDDPKYPLLLKKILSPPRQLFYKGNWDGTLFERCLAVVGSRRMTMYGKKVVDKLVSEVARCGITVVSGFMFGVDAAAHEACLKVGGRTLAVMPCGVDVVHPSNQGRLYEQILDGGGLIVSEFPDGHPPQLWTYAKRNRIVAGLSDAVLVVEAALASGSLITASYCLQNNRPLLAVPGSVLSDSSAGVFQLLKTGAQMTTCANDIFDIFGMTNDALSGEFSDLSAVQMDIMNALSKQPLSLDELVRLLGKSVVEMGSEATLLELRGIVEEVGGRYYVC